MKNDILSLQKRINYLQEKSKKIKYEIKKISHILFANYLNNELKLCDYKDQFVNHQNSKDVCYYTLKHDLTYKIFNWFIVNKIDTGTFIFKAMIVDVFDCHVATVKFIPLDKESELKFLNDYKIEFNENND